MKPDDPVMRFSFTFNYGKSILSAGNNEGSLSVGKGNNV
jgi:hypothetical protein